LNNDAPDWVEAFHSIIAERAAMKVSRAGRFLIAGGNTLTSLHF
jgi:hypothetical protein